MNALDVGVWIALLVLVVVSDLRWWRVAQREHYEPGRVVAIAVLWCRARPVNALLLVVAIIALGLGVAWPAAAVVGLVALMPWPLGLGVRPTTGRLVWTPRLNRVAATTLVIQAVGVAVAALLDQVHLVALVLLLAVELALVLMRPVEARLSRRYVVDAQRRLQQVRPDVVAITGSYGKTSTKVYTAHLVSAVRTTVASPASFNNLMGLSKAVNDRLNPGTDVFIAEMGTYGPGEIRKLSGIFSPRVAAITTIGEAHLERMGSRETIVAAKSEITEDAEVVVLNVDVPELDELARRLEGTRTVIRCSTTAGSAAQVHVLDTGGTWVVSVDGHEIGSTAAPLGGHPVNLAIAIGIVVGLGLPVDSVVPRLGSLPSASNRAEIQRTGTGVTIIDDTYNANPVGASAALRAARASAADGGRVFTITPGMIELGDTQVASNRALAAEATAHPDMTLAVVGLTNRAALVAGASRPPLLFADRAAATAAVMQDARAGDVVLYENDLPDHYP